MTTYAYRIVNVFAEATLAGNPLCVFEDARGLDATTMQALALQFNLSETTFILPSERATAHVRIFTPTFEMPFAGHPTLGTAYVVRALRGGGDQVTLDMKAGLIPVTADGPVWTLQANAPRQRVPAVANDVLAAVLGLDAGDIAGPPLWIDTGSEQLVIPLATADAVRRAAPRAHLMLEHASNGERAMAYVWAPAEEHGAPAADGRSPILARFFFPKHGAVIEDPGTGSACANLGGWFMVTGASLPRHCSVQQGAAVGRPCRLLLDVTAEGQIRVGGRVIELGRGTIEL